MYWRLTRSSLRSALPCPGHAAMVASARVLWRRPKVRRVDRRVGRWRSAGDARKPHGDLGGQGRPGQILNSRAAVPPRMSRAAAVSTIRTTVSVA